MRSCATWTSWRASRRSSVAFPESVCGRVHGDTCCLIERWARKGVSRIGFAEDAASRATACARETTEEARCVGER